MADELMGYFDPSYMGGGIPQAQTKSGQDAIARLLLQQQLDQQNAVMKQQYDQQRSQQDNAMQMARLQFEQQGREGPYGQLARQLATYGQQRVQYDPEFQAGQMLPMAVNEAFGSDANPWTKTIASALAGGFGQALSRNAYQSTMQNEVQPLYKRLFELSRDPSGGEKMLSDPQLAQFASPFVLQQLNDEAQMRKTRIDASGDWMKKGLGMNVGPNGAVSAGGIPGFAETNALTQGLEKRATADAQNMSDQQYDPVTAALTAKLGGKTGYQSPTLMPLTPEQKTKFAAQLNIDPNLLNTTGDVDRFLRMAQFSGEKTRPPSPGEIQQLASSERFDQTISQLKELAAGMSEDGGWLMGNLSRMGSRYADPSSPEYKYYALLKSAQQEYARARDAGALSNQDVNRYGPLFEGSPWLESKKDVMNRLDDILARGQQSRQIALENLKRGQVNVSGFTNNPIAGPTPQPVNMGQTQYPYHGDTGAAPQQAPQQPQEQMVTIRNKRTGETMQVPASALGG